MAKDCLLRYKRNGRVLAVASIYRDVESLKAEVAWSGTLLILDVATINSRESGAREIIVGAGNLDWFG
jgi:hypothetical protein